MKRFTFLLLNIMAFSIISFIEAKADTNEVVKYYTRTGIQKHDGGERVITHEQNGGAIFTFKANNIVTVQKLISESFVENEIEAKGTLSADGKAHYCLMSVSLSINMKDPDYEKYSPTLSTQQDIIKDLIFSTVGSHPIEEVESNQDGLREEILEAIQKKYNSKFVYNVVFRDIMFN